MECPRWSEPIFTKYMENNSSMDEILELHNHFGECQACSERFLRPLREMLDKPCPEADELVRKISNNPRWQKVNKDWAKIHARAISNHITPEEACEQLILEGKLSEITVEDFMDK